MKPVYRSRDSFHNCGNINYRDPLHAKSPQTSKTNIKQKYNFKGINSIYSNNKAHINLRTCCSN